MRSARLSYSVRTASYVCAGPLREVVDYSMRRSSSQGIMLTDTRDATAHTLVSRPVLTVNRIYKKLCSGCRAKRQKGKFYQFADDGIGSGDDVSQFPL